MTSDTLLNEIFRFVAVRPVQKVSLKNKSRWFFSYQSSEIAKEFQKETKEPLDFLIQYTNFIKEEKTWQEIKQFAKNYAISHQKAVEYSKFKGPFDALWLLFIDHSSNFNKKILLKGICEIIEPGSGATVEEEPTNIESTISNFLKWGYTILIRLLVFLKIIKKNPEKPANEGPVMTAGSTKPLNSCEVVIRNFLNEINKPLPEEGTTAQSFRYSLWSVLFALTLESNILQPVREKSIQYLRIIHLLKSLKDINSALDLASCMQATPLIPDSLFSSAPKIQINPKDINATFAEEDSFSSAYLRPLGYGDHKVVRQKLSKYLLGEIAHVENVMASEYKERKHRTLDKSEETLYSETETTTETEKDLQTTERFELQKEAEKTISTNIKFDAGVNVSASYGPVSVQAKTNFAMDSSKKESDKSASTYAKEIVSRSVLKINQRVHEERTLKITREIEEINTHGFDNKQPSSHVIGIYRWLNKIYKAQVVNYGKRFMFEFIIPEPAAFYIKANVEGNKLGLEEPKAPKSLTKKDNDNNPLDLEVDEIDETNYLNWVKLYKIADIPAPPETEIVKHVTVGTDYASTFTDSLKLDTTGMNNVNLKTVVEIPALYYPYNFSIVGTQFVEGPNCWQIFIGNSTLTQFRPDNGGIEFAPQNFTYLPDKEGNTEENREISGNLPIILYGWHCFWVLLNITVTFKRSERKYNEWKYKTYTSIINAYKQLKSDYDAKIDQENAATASSIQGKNPDINRLTEKQELKKSCISLMKKEPLDYKLIQNNFKINPTDKDETGYPEINTTELLKNAGEIQFLEQAFEWEQMTYLFYSYFWGLRKNWMADLIIEDPDPIFEKFLQAGAARVVVPVRPGYEFAVWHYLNTSELWGGGEGPVLDDDLYVSIAAELKEQANNITEDMIVDEWDVKIPTSLVYLQQDSSLPEES